MKKYILALVLSALILYLHTLGIEKSLYYYLWWYDIVLHTLGGIVLALFYSFFTKNWKLIVAAVIITATAWELLEYYLHLAGVENNYALDTIIDYAVALIGTGLVLWRK